MRRFTRLLTAGASVAALAAFPGGVLADPGEDHGHDPIPVPAPSLPKTPPGMQNMRLLDVLDKDGTTNSDLAFFGNTAYAGNYDGFRIVDIRNPGRLRLLSDTACRANQGDVSVFQGRDGRRYLLQSIDRPVTAPGCNARDTELIRERDEYGVERARARFGFEGLRLFDVTNPRSPRFVRFYRTACGSHTHTLVPDRRNGTMHAYVASYPLGSSITPQTDREQSDRLGLTCEAPHRGISIVSLPLADPEAGTVRFKELSDETEPYDPDGPFSEQGTDKDPEGTAPEMQACHDLQAFLPRNIMVASCAGDVQYWDISDRGDPTSGEGEPQTHIKRENGTAESFDFMHNATVTWDGRVAAVTDESGGGGEARCDAQNTVRGFTFFYPLVEPGTPVDGFAELGRYIVPRAQNDDICVSHNGNVLPIAGRYLQTQAFYMAGNTLFDFTNLGQPEEIAFSDLETAAGASDSWSSYFYNGVLYVNGGLNRRGETGNRGLEAYRLYDKDGSVLTGQRYRWMNPQTQEEFQAPRAERR